MNIESIISPTSVAVLGASNRKGSVGNAVIANIVNGGFAGKVYPVNPSSETILGLRCYRSILEIVEPVDIAVIITPSNVVPQVLEECGKKRVKAAVIISAGPNGTTQITQLNETVPGQHIYYPPAQPGPKYGIKVIGGCSINGGPLTTCIGSWMLKKNQNETASIHASTTFGPLRAPGVYEFVCTYHEDISMVGYLIVLPNKGYITCCHVIPRERTTTYSINHTLPTTCNNLHTVK